jgi:hypothetical protein
LDVLLVTNLAFLASIPERYAEEEVSIIINDLQLSVEAMYWVLMMRLSLSELSGFDYQN